MTTTAHTAPTTENRGLLPVGTVLPDGGVVLAVSLTAYKVRPNGYDLAHARLGGEACGWLSFDQVHGRPAPVEPLVVFA